MAQTAQYASAPKPGENSWLWMLKIITGPVLIVLIIVHFIVNHFIGETGLLTYADVVNYYKNPLIPAMEILFLISVVTHSLSGLCGVILDLRPSRPALKVIDGVLLTVGIVAVGYGAWLAMVIASH